MKKMERQEFRVYVENQREVIDQSYSRREISEEERDRLYGLIGETEKRYEEIRISMINKQVMLARLDQSRDELRLSQEKVSESLIRQLINYRI